MLVASLAEGSGGPQHEPGGEEVVHMPNFVVALPVLPGKEEPWRRFAQELLGSRLREYEGFRERLGLRNESVRLVHSPRQELAVAHLEVEDPERALKRLNASEEPFDVWFKLKLVELHGCDLAQPKADPEVIFAFPQRRESARIRVSPL